MMSSDSLKQIIRKNIIAPYLCKPLSKKLIPILGCQRSGTTLTFLILTSHPKIVGFDESDARFSFSVYSWRTLFKNSLEGNFTCLKLPMKVSELPYITRYYSNSRIIWPVRSCYATISSMKKLRMTKKTNWLESPLGSVQELKTLSTLFSEIKNIDVEHLRQTMPVALGAYVWKYKMLALRQYQKESLDVYDFRFEELVESPETLSLIHI